MFKQKRKQTRILKKLPRLPDEIHKTFCATPKKVHKFLFIIFKEIIKIIICLIVVKENEKLLIGVVTNAFNSVKVSKFGCLKRAKIKTTSVKRRKIFANK